MSILVSHRSPVVSAGLVAAVRQRFPQVPVLEVPVLHAVATDDLVRATVAVIDVALCTSAATEFLQELSTAGVSSIVLVDPSFDDPLRLLEAGVQGVVQSTDGLDGVLAAIEAVLAGHIHLPSHMVGAVLKSLIVQRRTAAAEANLLDSLSPRELETLRMLVSGLDHRDMAARMVISPHTAKTHIHRVLRKLDVRSRVEAAALAVHLGVEGIEP